MQVTITGSGTPIPCPGRAGPGVLVEAGQVLLQVDAGRATVLRLAECGNSPADLSALLLTHHHSDHMVDVADLLLTRWIRGGAMPFTVVVPDGPAVRQLEGLVDFWKDDIAVRQSHGRRPTTPSVHIVGFTPAPEPQEVWRIGDVVVSAVEVHHEPVRPAVAYRIDAPEGSAAVSGDTRVCDAVARLAQGADVLVHEAMRVDAVLAAGMPHVAAYHADTRELGRQVAGLGVGTLVLTHLEPSPRDRATEERYAAEVREGGYRGGLVVARDLVSVDHLGTVRWNREPPC